MALSRHRAGLPCPGCARLVLWGPLAACPSCDGTLCTDRRAAAPYDRARQTVRYPVKGLAGMPLCRWCGDPCEGRRTSWCSDRCADTYTARIAPSQLRHKLMERDGPGCRRCGINLEHLERRIRRMMNPPGAWRHGGGPYCIQAMQAYHVARRARCVLLRMGYDSPGSTVPYQVDHIIPVAEGGGSAGPENLRLLCTPCHKRITADWRARVARKNRRRKSRQRRVWT